MAKKISYLDNLKKEIGQTAKTASNALDKYLLGNRPVPKGIKIGPSNIKKEAGQLAGAIFMGARYNDKTGKRIVASKPKPMTGPLNDRNGKRVMKKTTPKKK